MGAKIPVRGGIYEGARCGAVFRGKVRRNPEALSVENPYGQPLRILAKYCLVRGLRRNGAHFWDSWQIPLAALYLVRYNAEETTSVMRLAAGKQYGGKRYESHQTQRDRSGVRP